MIFAHVSLQNPNLATRTRLADQFTRTLRDFALQHWEAILRAPDQMVLDVIIRCANQYDTQPRCLLVKLLEAILHQIPC